MVGKNIEYGSFYNRIPYARWGTGEKSMVIFTGGPGNTIPRGMGFQIMMKPLDSFIDTHTIYFLGRKQRQVKGYTTRQMADDYARLIEKEFNGSVDVIIGMSYGGLIAGHFAAEYPDHFRHIIFLVSAHKVSDTGKEIDYAFAQYLSQGKKRKAAVTILDALYSKGMTHALLKAIMWVIAPLVFKEEYASYKTDILIEAEAECMHDATESLRKITKPVLIIGGTEDVYFPRTLLEEAAGLINNAVLKLYEGRGHADAMRDERFVHDMLDFIENEPCGNRE
ncbi:MAG: alpha/beta hydrolase [Theionarchaea archaeon]|nr:alpha/beta hydrolase [Theionarchaea archaeon]